MGGNPQTGQERLDLRCFRAASRLVHFFSFLTACCILFCAFSLVPNFKYGITRPESSAEKRKLFRADPRGNGWSRSTLRSFLYGRKGNYERQQFGSLAFGGRGVGLLYNTRNWQVAHVSFDSTKGFPGEGWSSNHSNFKIGTWNTRSLTKERFNYCKSLKYDVLALGNSLLFLLCFFCNDCPEFLLHFFGSLRTHNRNNSRS